MLVLLDAAGAVATAFYLDAGFWAVLVAVIALVLSQLPPIKQLVRRAQITVDVFKRAAVTHSLGNPNVNLLLVVENVGGRSIVVTRVGLSLSVDSVEMPLQGQSYFAKPNDETELPLARIRLAPGEDWAHVVHFYNDFTREDERIGRAIKDRMRVDLEGKWLGAPEGDKSLKEVEPDLAQVALDFFNRNFGWKVGEYEVVLRVECDPSSASTETSHRFTLFESDIAVMKKQADRYKYGAGVVYPEKDTAVSVIVTSAGGSS